MASAIVIGDGACGLSAALLLSKNDVDTIVFGENETHLHDAYLYNYLGIEEIHGSDFIERSRQQCISFGTEIKEKRVNSVKRIESGFSVKAGGNEYISDYTVLATGTDKELAEKIDVEFEENYIKTNKDGETSIQDLYAGGWATRSEKIEAIISAGDGARIALDILSKEEGKPVHDFDVPPE